MNLLYINFGIFTCPANSGFWPVTVVQWLNNPKIGGSNPATGSGTVREKMAVKTIFFQTNSLATTAAPGSQEDSTVHEKKPS